MTSRLVATVLAVFFLAPVQAQEQIVVDAGSTMRFLANSADPGLGLDWTTAGFNDSSWAAGVYGVGYETVSGAENLIATPVPAGSLSVYTRTTFTVGDVSQVANLFLGVDHDDGYVAWLNGVEVFRAAMPPGAPDWNTAATSHESSNGVFPTFDQQDISMAGIPALQNGVNVLAIGAWNNVPTSSDLVLVPQLTINRALSLVRGPYLQSGTSAEITIRWRTAVDTDSRVDFGTAPGSEPLTLSEIGYNRSRQKRR